ncbi:hypothetical protein HDU82_000391 [Entophlyctis luteolus]|nr:hypothetical protein HDU82_000391 [Entophlyctis luteolus]
MADSNSRGAMSLRLLFALVAAAAVTAVPPPRGVSDEPHAVAPSYVPGPGATFSCLDGSKIIPYTAVNDDFCDCLDGSDEPGTSACPTGTFFCRNAGHVPGVVSSSRVNDGVCDVDECCDGSDEYASGVVCPDMCSHTAEIATIEKSQARKLADEGARKKEEFLARNAGKREEQKQQIAKLAQKVAQLEEDIAAQEAVVKELGANEERVRRDLGVDEAPQDETQDEFDDAPELPVEVVDAMEERVKAEEALEELKTSRDAVMVEITTLRALTSVDLGPNDALGVLAESCLEFDTPEYLYSLCFFTTATQKEKSSGRETNLGSWGGWTGRDLTRHSGKDLRYNEALFKDGEQCWNGPRRSLKLNLECGAENQIVHVVEPAKCEYEARILTVGLCESDEKDFKVVDHGIVHDEL